MLSDCKGYGADILKQPGENTAISLPKPFIPLHPSAYTLYIIRKLISCSGVC